MHRTEARKGKHIIADLGLCCPVCYLTDCASEVLFDCLIFSEEVAWPTVIYHVSTVFIRMHKDIQICSCVLFMLAPSTNGTWHVEKYISTSAFFYQ